MYSFTVVRMVIHTSIHRFTFSQKNYHIFQIPFQNLRDSFCSLIMLVSLQLIHPFFEVMVRMEEVRMGWNCNFAAIITTILTEIKGLSYSNLIG